MQINVFPQPGSGGQRAVDRVDGLLYQFMNLRLLRKFRKGRITYSSLACPPADGIIVDDDDDRRIGSLITPHDPGILDVGTEPQPTFNKLGSQFVATVQGNEVFYPVHKYNVSILPDEAAVSTIKPPVPKYLCRLLPIFVVTKKDAGLSIDQFTFISNSHLRALVSRTDTLQADVIIPCPGQSPPFRCSVQTF